MRRAHSEYPDELQTETIPGRSPNRIRFARPPMVTHAHATGGGRPGAIQLRLAAHTAASRMCSRTSIQLTRLSGPHIGRQGPLCATVTREDPDAHLPSEYDGFEAVSLCAPQTSIGYQLMPA